MRRNGETRSQHGRRAGDARFRGNLKTALEAPQVGPGDEETCIPAGWRKGSIRGLSNLDDHRIGTPETSVSGVSVSAGLRATPTGKMRCRRKCGGLCAGDFACRLRFRQRTSCLKAMQPSGLRLMTASIYAFRVTYCEVRIASGDTCTFPRGLGRDGRTGKLSVSKFRAVPVAGANQDLAVHVTFSIASIFVPSENAVRGGKRNCG